MVNSPVVNHPVVNCPRPDIVHVLKVVTSCADDKYRRTDIDKSSVFMALV